MWRPRLLLLAALLALALTGALAAAGNPYGAPQNPRARWTTRTRGAYLSRQAARERGIPGNAARYAVRKVAMLLHGKTGGLDFSKESVDNFLKTFDLPQARLAFKKSVAKLDHKEALEEIIAHPEAFKVLYRFMEAEFNSENIKFLMAIKQLKQTESLEEKQKLMVDIYKEYVHSNAEFQVNISGEHKLELDRAFAENFNGIESEIYDKAESEIFNLIKTDTFRRFKLNKEWENWHLEQEAQDRRRSLSEQALSVNETSQKTTHFIIHLVTLFNGDKQFTVVDAEASASRA